MYNYSTYIADIPEEIGNIKELEELVFEYNALTGSIPLVIFNMSSLLTVGYLTINYQVVFQIIYVIIFLVYKFYIWIIISFLDQFHHNGCNAKSFSFCISSPIILLEAYLQALEI